MRKTVYATLVAVLTLGQATTAGATDTHTGAMSEMKQESVTVGDLTIGNAMIRATPPGAPVSAGYMIISNASSKADRLIGGSAAFAGKVEVHEMRMDADVMKMRPVEGGLEIPASGEVALKPGGYHIMMMQLSEQMEEGQIRKLTLEFENAGTVELEVPVIPVGHANRMKAGGVKSRPPRWISAAAVAQYR